jgi:hypothetical protein
VEPFTGEGIGWALGDGAAVVAFTLRALEGSGASEAADWRVAQRARASSSRRLCRCVAWALRRSWLVRPSLELLSVAPDVARPLVRRAARAPASLTRMPA